MTYLTGCRVSSRALKWYIRAYSMVFVSIVIEIRLLQALLPGCETLGTLVVVVEVANRVVR